MRQTCWSSDVTPVSVALGSRLLGSGTELIQVNRGLLERSGSRLSRVRPGSTVSNAPATWSGVICCKAAMSGSPMAAGLRFSARICTTLGFVPWLAARWR